MRIPTEQQIQNITKVIEKSLANLIRNDSDIFNLELALPPDMPDQEKILNRELHETTINHRFAVYIEGELPIYEFDDFKVDIEYNRFYLSHKYVTTPNGEDVVARPDIIVHTRMNQNVTQQHLLVVEAKKWEISQDDINKVIGFISDPRYSYLFGYTISYCINALSIISHLYYYDGTQIVKSQILVRKNG